MLKRSVIIVMIIGVIIWGMYPYLSFQTIKSAIKEQDLTDKEGYVLFKVQKATVSEWIAIGDENGKYENVRDVRIIGEVPNGYNYDIEVGNNTFVCYGQYVASNLEDEAGICDVFTSTGWDILYPIKRNSPFQFILPKSYLCEFDQY